MHHPDPDPGLVDAIDAWLPQTQCTQCGYPRCLDYADAVARGEADVNQCPPGGDATIRGLASLVGRPPKPLNPEFGTQRARTVVQVDEPRCIGCTLCIQACPVDAIVGAARKMHTVIEAECTGCELCLPACPVDCIDVRPAPSRPADDSPWSDYTREETARARLRIRNRESRLGRRERERQLSALHREARSTRHRGEIKERITAAVSRVRARRRQNMDRHEQ